MSIDAIAEMAAQEEMILHLPDLHDFLYPDEFKHYASAPIFPADEWLGSVTNNDLLAFVFIGSNRQKLLAIDELKARYLKQKAEFIAQRAGSIAFEMEQSEREEKPERGNFRCEFNRKAMFEGMDDMISYGGTK